MIIVIIIITILIITPRGLIWWGINKRLSGNVLSGDVTIKSTG